MVGEEETRQKEVKLSLSSWIAIFTALTTLLGGLGLGVGKSVLGSSENPDVTRMQKELADFSKQLSLDERFIDRLEYRVQSLERQQGYDASDPQHPVWQRRKEQR